MIADPARIAAAVSVVTGLSLDKIDDLGGVSDHSREEAEAHVAELERARSRHEGELP